MNGPTCVWNPIVRERPHDQHVPARWRPAKWRDRDLRAKSPSSGRDISEVTDEADSLRMNLRQAKHALVTRDEETRRLRAAVTHLESALAQRERELRDTVSCLRGECPPRPHQAWLQEGTPTSRLRLQVHRLQRVAAAKQDHIEHLNRQASLGFLREAREQADEYRIEARRLARALAAITDGAGNSGPDSTRPAVNNGPQPETTEAGVLLVPGFGQDWGYSRVDHDATAAMVADRHSRCQPSQPKLRHVHPVGHPAPHPHPTGGRDGDREARELRAHHDGKNAWPITIRECLEDRSGERSLPWGSSTVRGTPPAPTGGGSRCATWRDEIPYDSLGLRPPLPSAAVLAGIGKTGVPPSAVVADGVRGCSPPARKTGLSRRSTGRAPDGVECWGPRQGHCSRGARGSSRPFDENARTSSMASSARLRLSSQQRTAERNIALALVEESRRLKAARAERKRRVRMARQKIARYRAERLRELESCHARRCGTRSLQVHRPTSAIHEEKARGSGRGDGHQDKGEGMSCTSDDRNGKAQHSKQRRAIEAALAAAVGATTTYVGEPRRFHTEEDDHSSCDESGIEHREKKGSHGGRQRRGLQESEADSGEETETWHKRDCGRDHGSPARPLGKPPLAPSRAVPSRNLSSQGQSGVTDGRHEGTDEDGGAKKRYSWDEENDAEEVQTEATSADGVEGAGEFWGDGDDDYDDHNSVREENHLSRSWSWEEGSATGGGVVSAPVKKEAHKGTGTVVNPGEICRGRPDCVGPRHNNISGRLLERSSRQDRNERDAALSDGLMMRRSGLHSGDRVGEKRQGRTEGEPRPSAPGPSTYELALPVNATREEGVAGADGLVARGFSREKTRVGEGNVGGTGNVPRRNVESGQTPTTSTVVGTDQSIGRGGQHGGERSTPPPADNHHRRGNEKNEGEEHTKTDPATTRLALPPDREKGGRSTAGQARGGESREALRVVADDHSLAGEGGKARNGGLATKERVGHAYAGGEEREEWPYFRGEELDDDDNYNSRWSLPPEGAAQEELGVFMPETSAGVGVERIGDVATAGVPEYQDDFFYESSARQYQTTDVSFAVSPPSEEEPEALEAAPTSPPLPMISAAPPTDPPLRPNSPTEDPAGDDWLISEPPTMATNKTRLGEAIGRRGLRRPRSAGGDTPDTRPVVSPPVPLLGTRRTRDMEHASFSGPVNAPSGGERETGLRMSSAQPSSMTAFDHGDNDVASPGATGSRKQNLSLEVNGDTRNVSGEGNFEEAKGDGRSAGEGTVGLDDNQRRDTTTLSENLHLAVEMGVSRDVGATVGKDGQSSVLAAEPSMAYTITQEEKDKHAPINRQDAVLDPGDRSKHPGFSPPVVVVGVDCHDMSDTHEPIQVGTDKKSPDHQTINPGGTRAVGGDPSISNHGGSIATTALDLATPLTTSSQNSKAPDGRHIVDAEGRDLEFLASSFSLPIEDTHDVGNAAHSTASLDTEPPPVGSPPHIEQGPAEGESVIDVRAGTGLLESELAGGPTRVHSDAGSSVIGRSGSSPSGSSRQPLRDDDDGDDLGGSASKTSRLASSSPCVSSDIRGEAAVGSPLTPLLAGRDQRSQGCGVLEGDAKRKELSSPALSSRTVLSESHAELSVDSQSIPSSREGDASVKATLDPDDAMANVQVGVESSDGRGGSSAVSATEESSAAAARSSHSGSGSVLEGDGGGIDTIDNDDGYF